MVTGLGPYFCATMRPALSRTTSLAVRIWPLATAGVELNLRTALTGPLARVAVWLPALAALDRLPVYVAALAGELNWTVAREPVTAMRMAVVRGANGAGACASCAVEREWWWTSLSSVCWAALPLVCGDGRCSGRRGIAPEFLRTPTIPNFGYARLKGTEYKQACERAGPSGTGPVSSYVPEGDRESGGFERLPELRDDYIIPVGQHAQTPRLTCDPDHVDEGGQDKRVRASCSDPHRPRNRGVEEPVLESPICDLLRVLLATY